MRILVAGMDEVAEAFAEFDLDKSGGLSLQELRARELRHPGLATATVYAIRLVADCAPLSRC
eukprot:COSAG05_NODE_210_length_14015_cov_3.851785_10_plen_62_part_00